jgi:hypothetical protein
MYLECLLERPVVQPISRRLLARARAFNGVGSTFRGALDGVDDGLGFIHSAREIPLMVA